MVETGMPAFEREDDLDLLADALPASIKLLETVLANDPDNPRLLVFLAQAYGVYAFAVLETAYERCRYAPSMTNEAECDLVQMESRMKRYFSKGMDCAGRALEIRRPGALKMLNRPRDAEALLAAMAVSDVPAVFWYGFNLGFHVQHSLDDIRSLAKAHLVEKTMQRVITLAPDYYRGSAHVIMLVYYASRSPMMGGNPRKAVEYYRRHQQAWPEMAGLRELYWARYHYVRQQDRDGFRRTLNQLIATPVGDAHPLKMLESVARSRAQVYLQAEQRLFEGF